ncbi:MAG TPA: hypothetical protein VL461_13455 [Dictyobacter sp.]|nr:hypothetical protein [Dictyobacter sp.]
MYKFKGFDSTLCGDSMTALEAIINAWMDEERPRIRQMCQSIRGEHIILSFVYEETSELERRTSTQTQTGVGITGGIPRIFDDDELGEEQRPTRPSIPATPPPYTLSSWTDRKRNILS